MIKRRISILLLFPVLFLHGISSASQIKFNWNPNPPQEEVNGYNLYYHRANSSDVNVQKIMVTDFSTRV